MDTILHLCLTHSFSTAQPFGILVQLILHAMTTPTSFPPGLEAGFSLHVTVHIAVEDLPAFFEVFDPLVENVKKEKELLFMEVFQDPAELGTLSWVESWYVLFTFCVCYI